MQAILGTKIDQTQKFLDDGTRIPVTSLWVKGNTVVFVKTKDKHNYSSVQLGLGIKKNANKALLGHIKGTLNTAPKFLKEIRFEEENISEMPAIGKVINATEVFKPGDMVDVIGISKGKGYAGVVKRHHFKGGPRTHGQSDRERAPGSIGQTTTPGRVYKGKRMAGRMGHERVTIKNLEVVGVSEDTLLIKGLVPGGKNTLIMVTKIGENKKFVPLYGATEEVKGEENEDQEGQSDDVQQSEGHSGTSQSISGDARVSEENQNEIQPSLSDDSKTKTNLKDKIDEDAVISSPENKQSGSPEEDSIKEVDMEDKENAG